MVWPTPQDYNEAIQSPPLCFSEPELKAGVVELNALGLPKSASGAFASVYKITTTSGPWAVRCFLRFLPEQAERYRKISEFVLFDNLDCTVDFHFHEKGIFIRGAWYPILKMRWVDGDTLDQYINKIFKDPQKMSELTTAFFNLVMELENADIAHGDLQHGNIIVSPDGLRLVDYDALFVPALAGEQNLEFGHPNYQHPMRSQNHFDPTVDNFSTWLIHSSLQTVRTDPELFTRFIGGDDCILFRRKDLVSPETSELFKTLLEHESSEINNMARILMRMLWAQPYLVPPIHASAYELSALLPNIQPEASSIQPLTTGLDVGQSESDINEILSTTVARSDTNLAKYKPRKKKFKFKETAIGLSKNMQANVLKAVDAGLRKSRPLTWTSVKLREGDKHFDSGEYDEAIAAFIDVQTNRKDFLEENVEEMIDLHLRLGRAFGMKQNANMACNYFMMAMRLAEQNNMQLPYRRSRFLFALAKMQAGRDEEACDIIAGTPDLAASLEKIMRAESRFGYVMEPGTLRLIESYAHRFTIKQDFKKAVEILEIGHCLTTSNILPVSSAFRHSYIHLLIRLGATYVKLGFLSYATGIADKACLLCDTYETDGVTKLRVCLFSACVAINQERQVPIEPPMTRLAKCLTERNPSEVMKAVESYYPDFGAKATLGLLLKAANYLREYGNRQCAAETARLAWRLLVKEEHISHIERLRMLKQVNNELHVYCLDGETTNSIVKCIGSEIEKNRSLSDTEVILAALKPLDKAAEPVIIAVLDEMIRLVRKHESLQTPGLVTRANTLIRQYDFSKTRLNKLDGIIGN